MSIFRNPIRFFHLLCLEILIGAVIGFCAMKGWRDFKSSPDIPPAIVEQEHKLPGPKPREIAAPAGDRDGDGLPDSWEIEHHHDPDNSADAGVDFDADGLTALQEYRAGKNPLGAWRIDSSQFPAALNGWTGLAERLNDPGKVIVNFGWTEPDGPDQSRAFICDPATNTWTELHPAQNAWSFQHVSARDINNLGDTLLVETNSMFQYRGLLRKSNGQLQELVDAQGRKILAHRLNNEGEWIGRRLSPDSAVYFVDGVLHEAPSWDDLLYHDINNLGEVVGSYADAETGSHFSFIEDRGSFHSTWWPEDHPHFNPLLPLWDSPLAINDAGMVIGGAHQPAVQASQHNYLSDSSLKVVTVGGEVVPGMGIKGLDAVGRVLTMSPAGLWHGGVFVEIDEIGSPVPAESVLSGGINDRGAFVVTDVAGRTIHLFSPAQDQDGDGMADDWEDVYGFNKNLASDAALDRDGDGKSNLEEFNDGTDPLHAAVIDPATGLEIDLRPGVDSDGDGIPNEWEWEHGLDYNDPSDATGDPDRDGYTNRQEFWVNTNPFGRPSFAVEELPLHAGAQFVAAHSVIMGKTVVGSATIGGLNGLVAWKQSVNGGLEPFVLSRQGLPASNLSYARSDEEGRVLARIVAPGSTNFVYWSSLEGTPQTLNPGSLGTQILNLSPRNGWIAGSIRTAGQSNFRPFIQKLGASPLFPAAAAGMTVQAVDGINSNGTAIGKVRDSSGQYRPMIWDSTGLSSPVAVPIPVGVLPTNVSVNGISDETPARVAGTYMESNGLRKAFMWRRGDPSLTIIATPAGSSPVVSGISSQGLVYGHGYGFEMECWSASAGSGWQSEALASGIDNPGSIPSLWANGAGEILSSEYDPSEERGRVFMARFGEIHELGQLVTPGGAMVAGVSGIASDGVILATLLRSGLSTLCLLVPQADTDGDGIPDTMESAAGLNPFNAADGSLDADGDGLSNAGEVSLGSDILKTDSDGDGMPDGWERDWGFSPSDPYDAYGDADSDGLSNRREYEIGTSPHGKFVLGTVTVQDASKIELIDTSPNGNFILLKRMRASTGETDFPILSRPEGTWQEEWWDYPTQSSAQFTPQSIDDYGVVFGRFTDGSWNNCIFRGGVETEGQVVTVDRWGDSSTSGFIVASSPDRRWHLASCQADGWSGYVVINSSGIPQEYNEEIVLPDEDGQWNTLDWFGVDNDGLPLGFYSIISDQGELGGDFIRRLPRDGELEHYLDSYYRSDDPYAVRVQRHEGGPNAMDDEGRLLVDYSTIEGTNVCTYDPENGLMTPVIKPRAVPLEWPVAVARSGDIIGAGGAPWLSGTMGAAFLPKVQVTNPAGQILGRLDQQNFGPLQFPGFLGRSAPLGVGRGVNGQATMVYLSKVVDEDQDGVADDYEIAAADWLRDEFGVAAPLSPAQFDVDHDYASLGRTTRDRVNSGAPAPTRLEEGGYRGYLKQSWADHSWLPGKEQYPEYYYRTVNYAYHEKEIPGTTFPKREREINRSEVLEYVEPGIDEDSPTGYYHLFWEEDYKSLTGDYYSKVTSNATNQTDVQTSVTAGDYNLNEPDDEELGNSRYDLTTIRTLKNGTTLPPLTSSEMISPRADFINDEGELVEGADSIKYVVSDDQGPVTSEESWELTDKIHWRDMAKSGMQLIKSKAVANTGGDSYTSIFGGYGGGRISDAQWVRGPNAQYQSIKWVLRAGDTALTYKLVKKQLIAPPPGTATAPHVWTEVTSEPIVVAPHDTFILERDTIPDNGYDRIEYKLQPLHLWPSLVPVSPSGELLDKGSIPMPSISGPKIQASVSISNAVIDSGGDPVVNFTFGGTITSKACDMVNGAAGKINHVSLVLNGRKLPGQIAATAFKTNGSGPFKYRFHATIGGTATGIGVVKGPNRLSVEAVDPVTGCVGSHEFAFNVSINGTIDDDENISSPTVSVTPPTAVSQTGEGETFPYYIEVWGLEGLTQAELSNYKFVAADGSPMEDLVIDPATSRVFVADPNRPDEPMGVILKPSFGDTVTAGQADMSWEKADILEALAETLDGVEQFQKGFGHGLWDGGADMVKSTGETVKGVGDYLVNGFGAFGSMVNITIFGALGDDDGQEEAWRQLEFFEGELKPANDQLYQLGGFVQKLATEYANMQSDIFLSIFGDPLGLGAQADEAKVRLSATQHMALMICYELFEIAKEELGNITPYELGKICGRIFFEVAAMVIPAAGATAVTKAGVLTRLVSEAKLVNVTTKTGWGNAVTRITALANKFATTKMCFVAGTPVWTGDGLRPIEDIRPGEMVWSTPDSGTGIMELKPVVRTFVTRPAELFELAYDEDGDGASDGTLEGTANHPVWVEEDADFVEMAHLQPGDTLRLGWDGSARVLGVTPLSSGGDGAPVTYNFEVKDFHTYYVGSSGVWVHNAGKAACQRALSIFSRFLKRTGDDVWASFRFTRDKIPNSEASEVLRVKVLNEARRKHFELHPDGDDLIGPWHGTAGQNLTPAGGVGSSKVLGENMELVYGSKRPYHMQSHHIVEKNANPAARKVLEDAGISIDEAANGVWLPNPQMSNRFEADVIADLGRMHNGSHSVNYRNAINERILDLAGQPAHVIRNELQKIAKELSDGTFTWP